MDHGVVDTDAQRLTRAKELGELVDAKPENVDAALPELEALLAAATDPETVAEVVVALGLAWDPRASQIILKHVPLDHQDQRVRLETTRAIANGVDPGDSCWEPVVDALIALSRDTETAVRDWACFELGQHQATTPAALDALADRLTDPDNDTRCEALAALATACDPRALEHLQRRLALDVDSDDVWKLELSAAADLADPELFSLLARLERDWDGDQDDFTELLAFALKRCHPDARAKAQHVEHALIGRVNDLLAGTSHPVQLRGNYPRTTVAALGETGGAGHSELSIWPEQEPETFRLEQTAIQMNSHFSQQDELTN